MLAKRRRFWWPITIILLLSLVMAACGGDDDDGDNGDGGENPTTETNVEDTTDGDPFENSALLPLEFTQTYMFESGSSFQYPGDNWFLFDDETVPEGVVITYQGGEERAANGVALDQEDLVVSVPNADSLETLIQGYVAQSPLWPTVTLEGVLFTERTTPDGRQMLYTTFADQSSNEVLIIGVDLGNGGRGLMYFTSTAQEHPADIEEALLQVAETFIGAIG